MHPPPDLPQDPSYPPAPWQLAGTSIQTVRFVDAAAAARLLPPDLRIVRVWPRRTVGVLYCASYEPPSQLRYHELIVAPALVAARGRIGFWISHIYVDDAASLAGGRGIWGLPKSLATFDWRSERGEVAVREGPQRLCRIRWDPGGSALPVPLYLPALSRCGSQLRRFAGLGRGLASKRRATVEIDAGGLLPDLGFSAARSLWEVRQLRLTVSAPRPLSDAGYRRSPGHPPRGTARMPSAGRDPDRDRSD